MAGGKKNAKKVQKTTQYKDSDTPVEVTEDVIKVIEETQSPVEPPVTPDEFDDFVEAEETSITNKDDFTTMGKEEILEFIRNYTNKGSPFPPIDNLKIHMDEYRAQLELLMKAYPRPTATKPVTISKDTLRKERHNVFPMSKK